MFVSACENDVNIRIGKAWAAIDRKSPIWKSDLSDKIKREFFRAVAASVLLYGCTSWTRTKPLRKKLDKNYSRILCAVLNKFFKHQPSKQ